MATDAARRRENHPASVRTRDRHEFRPVATTGAVAHGTRTTRARRARARCGAGARLRQPWRVRNHVQTPVRRPPQRVLQLSWGAAHWKIGRATDRVRGWQYGEM